MSFEQEVLNRLDTTNKILETILKNSIDVGTILHGEALTVDKVLPSIVELPIEHTYVDDYHVWRIIDIQYNSDTSVKAISIECVECKKKVGMAVETRVMLTSS